MRRLCLELRGRLAPSCAPIWLTCSRPRPRSRGRGPRTRGAANSAAKTRPGTRAWDSLSGRAKDRGEQCALGRRDAACWTATHPAEKPQTFPCQAPMPDAAPSTHVVQPPGSFTCQEQRASSSLSATTTLNINTPNLQNTFAASRNVPSAGAREARSRAWSHLAVSHLLDEPGHEVFYVALHYSLNHCIMQLYKFAVQEGRERRDKITRMQFVPESRRPLSGNRTD